MNKVKIFEERSHPRRLEEAINKFAENHKILNTSICTEKHGYDIYYNVVVLYEEN